MLGLKVMRATSSSTFRGKTAAVHAHVFPNFCALYLCHYISVLYIHLSSLARDPVLPRRLVELKPFRKPGTQDRIAIITLAEALDTRARAIDA